MIQIELPFGTEPHKLVRLDDPSTSYEAALSIDTKKLEELVYQTIKAFGHKGCISDDVREKLSSLSYSSVTARYKALADKKMIEYLDKIPGRSGRKQRIMRAI